MLRALAAPGPMRGLVVGAPARTAAVVDVPPARRDASRPASWPITPKTSAGGSASVPSRSVPRTCATSRSSGSPTSSAPAGPRHRRPCAAVAHLGVLHGRETCTCSPDRRAVRDDDRRGGRSAARVAHGSGRRGRSPNSRRPDSRPVPVEGRIRRSHGRSTTSPSALTRLLATERAARLGGGGWIHRVGVCVGRRHAGSADHSGARGVHRANVQIGSRRSEGSCRAREACARAARDLSRANGSAVRGLGVAHARVVA